MIAKRFLVFVLFNACFNLFAQQSDSGKKTENYFRFNYENDFFSATDRYYTQGIFLDFIHPIVRHSPFSYCLLKLTKQAINYYGFHIEQDVFTPRSIRYKGGQIYYGERPFTAVFFISHSLHSLNPFKKMLLKTQLDIGILGPYARGEEEQKGIHKALKNIEPLGWQNQLSSDVVLNYTAKFEKGILSKKRFELMGNAFTKIGTLYTNIGIGTTARLGFFSPYFTNLGLEKIPFIGKHSLKCYLVTSVNFKFVAYNATLQGGLTNSGNKYELPDAAIARLVADLSVGIVLAYKRTSLEYGKSYITPEFKKGLDHSWGKCSVTVCF